MKTEFREKITVFSALNHDLSDSISTILICVKCSLSDFLVVLFLLFVFVRFRCTFVYSMHPCNRSHKSSLIQRIIKVNTTSILCSPSIPLCESRYITRVQVFLVSIRKIKKNVSLKKRLFNVIGFKRSRSIRQSVYKNG